jgi:hypothetical protein
MWGGNPAVFVRDLTKAEIMDAESHAKEDADIASAHNEEFLPVTTAYAMQENRLSEVAKIRAQSARLSQLKAQRLADELRAEEERAKNPGSHTKADHHH